jgi:hypothetical protein
MTISSRALVLVFAICCLAVGASITAERALANGSTEYCNNCTLPSSGVPAQSAVFKDFYYNDMSSTQGYVNAQVYNYYSGTTTCSYFGDHVVHMYTGYPGPAGQTSCIPSTVFSSARCHLLDGTGL